ncbi:hypothetical protein ELQ90_03045 [Labedella phragmitis]|uniref:Uncharacterized protein n=1 Tax=Labedella phragmitis TaxID=2498849 RepID=A0A444PYH6_9MICO|nr:hypothetical protein [Labedella phragmitis]RWZ52926.1 hypothetical protein ELQ90_03045 [Labedella phragmitis]
MYATTPDTRTPRELAEELNAMRHDMLDAADRAELVTDHEERLRAATQVAFVATLAFAGNPDYIALALSWLDAGRRMLSVWETRDMDAVHASRLARRESSEAAQ